MINLSIADGWTDSVNLDDFRIRFDTINKWLRLERGSQDFTYSYDNEYELSEAKVLASLLLSAKAQGLPVQLYVRDSNPNDGGPLAQVRVLF